MTLAYFEKPEKILIATTCGMTHHVTADIASNHIEGLVTFELNRRKVAQAGVANLLFWAVVEEEEE